MSLTKVNCGILFTSQGIWYINDIVYNLYVLNIYICIYISYICLIYRCVCVYDKYTYISKIYVHTFFHICIFLLGTSNCIPFIPVEVKYSKGLGKGSGTCVLHITTFTSWLFVKENPHTVIFSAYNFRTFFAYAFSNSGYLSAYPSLLYVRFYRAIWQQSFVFYWMFSWCIWSDTDEQPRWDFGVY